MHRLVQISTDSFLTFCLLTLIVGSVITTIGLSPVAISTQTAFVSETIDQSNKQLKFTAANDQVDLLEEGNTIKIKLKIARLLIGENTLPLIRIANSGSAEQVLNVRIVKPIPAALDTLTRISDSIGNKYNIQYAARSITLPVGSNDLYSIQVDTRIDVNYPIEVEFELSHTANLETLP